MRIGIDLDHTILHQGQGNSEILFGLKAFVIEQRSKNRQVLVLCYTEDQGETSIQKMLAGLGLFKPTGQGGFGFSDNDLVFVATNDEMIAKVKALKLTHFISTQPGLMTRDDFPESVQPLLLDNGLDEVPGFSDWSSMTDYFTWGQGVEGRLAQVETLRDYGENHVFKVRTGAGKTMVLKRHMEEDDCAATKEVAGLAALQKAGITNIPQPIWNQGGWTLSSWIEGKPVAQANSGHVQQIVDFLLSLYKNREILRGENLGNAGNARLNYQDYLEAVSKLWKEVMNACQRPDGPKDVLLFMMTDMEQMRQDNQNHLYLWCKRRGWEKEEPFKQEQLMFCPADFGLHNAIETDGKLVFIDFENSGWDDPAHLLANFFHNPGQNITREQRLEVLNGFVAGIDWGEEFLNRFWAIADLVAVEWIFKTLYVLVPEEMRRQVYLNPGLDTRQLIKDRFKQALKMKEEFVPMENLCKHSQLLDNDTELK